MEPFFEEQSGKIEEVEFPQYFLSNNPFPSELDLTEGEGEDEDFYSLFCRQLYQREVDVIADHVLNESKKGKKKFWLLKNEKIIAEHNISIVTGLFRALTTSPVPRIFSAYIPFPVIVRDPLGGILQWLNDRLSVDRFRLCVCVFIYDELKKLQESGLATKSLSDIDLTELLQNMNQTKGEAINDILFVEEPQEMSEQKGEDRPEIKQNSGEQIAADDKSTKQDVDSEEREKITPEELEAKRKEFEQKKKIRDEFILFIEEKISKSEFSPQAKAALAVAITKGFEKGRSYVGLGEYRESLKALLSLASLFYENAVVILDRLENWDMLDDTQQANTIGVLTELKWLFGEFGLLVLSSYNRTAEAIGEDFVGTFEKLSFDLWPVTLDLKSPIPIEKAEDLLSYFIQFDRHRKEKSEELKASKLPNSYPFTEEGILELVEQVKGDIGKYLIHAGRLLEAGKNEQYPLIDAEFVKKHSFKEE